MAVAVSWRLRVRAQAQNGSGMGAEMSAGEIFGQGPMLFALTETREAEMPLTPEETAVLRSLSEPVDQRRRGDFIAQATRRLEAAPDHGPGRAHQIGRVVQRHFRDPPDLRKGRVGPRG